MELRDYLRIARRRWLLILGSVVVLVAIAAAVTAQTTRLYASTARVFISTTPSTSSDAYQGGALLRAASDAPTPICSAGWSSPSG